MTLRFVHAADLHLDSPLRGLTAYESAPVSRIRGATRQAFSNLVDTTIAQAVPLLVLAGDVWDGDWPDIGTGLFFVAEMGRLEKAGVRVALVRGNHDAESRITKALRFPETVHVFAHDRPETLLIDDLGAALHGRSFDRPDLTENIALGYPDAVADRINIGLLHTALEGNASHAHYAPCRLSELQTKGYDYWALGHVHEHQILAQGQSGAEGGTIAFPGVLQGRHIRESGAKGALLVEIDEGRITVDRLILDVVRWHSLPVDVSDCSDLDEVVRRLGQGLRHLAEAADARLDERLLAVRIVLTGRCRLQGSLGLELDQLRNEALAQAAAIAPDGFFIEKLEIATEPAIAAETLAARHDAIADLQGLLAQVDDDDALIEGLESHLRDLLKQLPAEALTALRASDPKLVQALESGTLGALLPDVRDDLIDHLAQV